MKLCMRFFFLKSNMSFDRQVRIFFFCKYKHFRCDVFILVVVLSQNSILV